MTGFIGHEKTYIIAEIGSNHGGSFAVALDLIDAAAAAGADAAKFQAGHADHVYDPVQFPGEHAGFKKYIQPVLGWFPKLAQRCSERGIDFGCSAFCLDALDAVDPFVKWHKVASIEHTWGELITAVALKKKPYLVSLGATDEDDDWPWYPGNNVLMHCTVSYPAAPDEVNLRSHPRIDTCRWGLSDHTVHPTVVPCAAVVMGACVVEKHFRLDSQYECWEKPPDWDHSLWPEAFAEMVRAIRLTETVLGSDEKRIRPSERPYLKYRRGPRGLRGA